MQVRNIKNDLSPNCSLYSLPAATSTLIEHNIDGVVCDETSSIQPLRVLHLSVVVITLDS